MTVTAHFIDKKLNIRNIVLDTTDASHTAVSRRVYYESNVSYNVEHKSLLATTTDNVTNYVNAVERHLQIINITRAAE